MRHNLKIFLLDILDMKSDSQNINLNFIFGKIQKDKTLNKYFYKKEDFIYKLNIDMAKNLNIEDNSGDKAHKIQTAKV